MKKVDLKSKTNLDKLLFGISGLPIGDGSHKFNYASGIEYVKSIGLDAMELLFVRSVNVTAKNKSIIFHPGYYLKDSKEDTYNTIKKNLLKLPYKGVDYRKRDPVWDNR